jgi:capsular polysaccharide biosynthesis protein
LPYGWRNRTLKTPNARTRLLAVIERTTLDFWDITKLLVRRWQVALPLLLLSAVITGVTVSQVKPDYVATAYVQLVPPAAVKNTTPEQQLTTADQRNPWLAQGLETLGNAAIVQALDLSVVEEFKRTGYADVYTVTMGQNSPLVTFEITGTSARQARDTAEKLVTVFTDSVARLQTSLAVTEPNLITVKRLDLGGNVVKSTSKIKRALIAVAAAGILLTAGLTIGIDAWLRRRITGRRTQFDEDDLESSATAPLPSSPPARRDRGANGGPAKIGGTRQVPVVAGAAAGQAAGDAGLTVEYQRPANWDSRDREPEKQTLDADSTVIIPLSAMPPKPTATRGKSG